MRRQVSSLLFGAAALALISAPAAAQKRIDAPQVQFVPTKQAPTPPQGLNLGCVKASNDGAPTSDSCPVVKYQGLTTWAFSYNDNRVSFALVSYDERGNVVRNVEKPGARYIFDMLASPRSEMVVLVGQAQKTVIVPLSDFGTASTK